MTDEAQLAGLRTLGESRGVVRAGFLEQLDALRSQIHKAAAARPKQLMKQRLNGPMFLHMLRSYVDALNSGATPTVSDA
eukprot:SAG11_NODE_452_length_9380_cov_10.655533_7_plen_79_part_00